MSNISKTFNFNPKDFQEDEFQCREDGIQSPNHARELLDADRAVVASELGKLAKLRGVISSIKASGARVVALADLEACL